MLQLLNSTPRSGTERLRMLRSIAAYLSPSQRKQRKQRKQHSLPMDITEKGRAQHAAGKGCCFIYIINFISAGLRTLPSSVRSVRIPLAFI
jgi:hypothetical protein